MTITQFLLARIAEDEAVARACAEMFPPPWDVADRGWRVRIYASDVTTEDFASDDEDATTVRNPVVMEVEPDRRIKDPQWLSERVEHVRRHDPARILAECAAKRAIVELHVEAVRYVSIGRPEVESLGCETCAGYDGPLTYPCPTLRHLATPYAEHPDYDAEWSA